ncbi:hypothetical protein [Henriciella litoralis]|uniref:hypothetical protein n=1 Tax=Henriciella litoralis TaxID=568102 RepID=UPI0009FC0CBD|nr:hypothetical protein [Henriciella litoralis]
MTINWPKTTKKDFGNEILEATHTLDQSPLFSDDALAALLDAYPRERLGVWTFADHSEGEEAPVRGIAGDLSGAEILRAVKRGRIWLNLRATNQLVEAYSQTGEAIFDSLQNAAGRKVMKRDMSVLISSPGIHVHYHLDIPLVALLQVRGEKTIWLYPPTRDFAPDERVEAIVLREQEEGLAFKSGFEASARQLTLKPGMALTWPQTAPHRVQNADVMNVSLSCEFMTMPALLKANALYTNGRLRRGFGAKPSRPNSLTAGTIGKAALARVLKKLEPQREPTAPTPASFELDLDSETCTRPAQHLS